MFRKYVETTCEITTLLHIRTRYKKTVHAQRNAKNKRREKLAIAVHILQIKSTVGDIV